MVTTYTKDGKQYHGHLPQLFVKNVCMLVLKTRIAERKTKLGGNMIFSQQRFIYSIEEREGKNMI